MNPVRWLPFSLFLLGACAHAPAEPAEPQAATEDPCRGVLLAEERYRDAERACAVYSRETFNWHDCMVARKVQPANPPPYRGDDEPDCHQPSLKPVLD